MSDMDTRRKKMLADAALRKAMQPTPAQQTAQSNYEQAQAKAKKRRPPG